MFEKFDVPAFYTCPQEVLSLYASDLTTGIVVDCGYTTSHIIPVYEG